MNNVVLIGMPSSGKSAVGIRLAQLFGYGFIDSDLVIQGIEGKRLSKLIEEHGAEGFLKIEERVNCGLDVSRCVIATGGSAVYSDPAMKFFKQNAKIVYLKISAETVKNRIPDLVSRGVVMRGTLNSVDDLYRERIPLYEKYADITVECDSLTLDETASRCAALVRGN
ncbi:MAG: shikimate kinase [Clostridia bacterium]|nr:shikimate kinase [Clostridia bacterium]